MELNDEIIGSHLQKIAEILRKNVDAVENPGLFSGKMGITLFFCRYANFIESDEIYQYSVELIEKILEEIHVATSVDYRNGLTGIGTAIEYLVQNDYLAADTDEMLEAIDKQVFDTKKNPDLHINDLLGTGFYAFWRMSGKSIRKGAKYKTCLARIVRVLEAKCQNFKRPFPLVKFFKDVIASNHPRRVKGFGFIPLSFEMDGYLKHTEIITEKHFKNVFLQFDYFFKKDIFDLGLQTGLAGVGMSLMTESDGNDRWLSLFPDDLMPKKDEHLSRRRKKLFIDSIHKEMNAPSNIKKNIFGTVGYRGGYC